jgi:N-acetylneuraminate synthase
MPPKKEIEYLDALVRGVYAKEDLPEGHQLTDRDVYLAIPLHKGQLSCRELMNGELLLNPVKADQAIRIDDIESPYSQIPSLRKTIYARGISAPVEPTATALDNVHLMPSGTEEPSRK